MPHHFLQSTYLHKTTIKKSSLQGVVAIALILMTACGGGSSDGGANNTGGQKVIGIASPTYHKDIAPILNNNCVACHREGGIAPFKLDNYADAGSHHIDVATDNGTMPPYLADNSGQCNTFKDARVLSDADIATINHWVDDGMPEGTPPVTPLEPPPQLSLAPSEVSATAMMQAPYSPAGNTEHPDDDYRCFIIDPGLTTDKILTAYEVKPGNDSLVHHIILYGLKSDIAETDAATLDSADMEPGYTCFGGSGIQGDNYNHVAFLAGWAPGLNVTRFPTDTGIRVLANHKLIMQVHYNLANGSGSDQTAVDLSLAEPGSISKEAFVLPIADTDMVLAAGQTSVSTSVTMTLPFSARIHGVFPHMHTLGKEIHVEKITSSGNQCIVDVPRWSFEWQQFFFYSETNSPVVYNTGDTLKLSCTYDTHERTSPVTWGDGTQDEMCINFFYMTLP